MPLSAYFILMQPLSAAPCGHVGRLSRTVVSFLLCKYMDQGQYLLADNNGRLHLLPRFQVMV
ncbi:hypothetical protein D7X25_30085 [bacterium 1XD42-8]|nr:hypothetical protein D7X25_30085 [bacterium 1XD42-8]